MAYEAKPGSVAQRVISYLETLAPGAEVMTSPIAEAIGIEPTLLSSSLIAAVAHGAVFRRQRLPGVRAPVWWSLVDHSGGTRPAVAASAPPVAGARKVPEPAPEPPSAVTAAPVPGRARLRVAQWSDGAVQIYRGDKLVLDLDADEGGVLEAYFAR